MARIRAVLLQHKVVFFRGQRLSHVDHIAFGRRFGALTRRPGRKHGAHLKGYPEILTVDPDEEDTRYGRRFEERLRPKARRHDSGWHVDLTAAVNPSAVSVLRVETADGLTAATPSGPTWSRHTRGSPAHCRYWPMDCARNTPSMPPASRCLQPANRDHTDHHHTLYRVTVLGDHPAGPDDFTSEAVRGDPRTACTDS